MIRKILNRNKMPTFKNILEENTLLNKENHILRLKNQQIELEMFLKK